MLGCRHYNRTDTLALNSDWCDCSEILCLQTSALTRLHTGSASMMHGTRAVDSGTRAKLLQTVHRRTPCEGQVQNKAHSAAFQPQKEDRSKFPKMRKRGTVESAHPNHAPKRMKRKCSGYS